MKQTPAPSRRRRRLFGCLAAVILFLGFLANAGRRAAVMVARAKEKPLEFATVKRGTMAVTVSETGTIEAGLQVEVKSKVAGRIKKLLVDEGDKVSAGQLVAEVDPTEVEREANQAAADVDAARARLQQAVWNARQQSDSTRLSIPQAEAHLGSLEANLRRMVAGSRPQEISRAEAQVARARADAEDARQALERAVALQKAGSTAREDAEAALAAARADLQRIEAGARPEEIARAKAVVAQTRATAEDAARTLERKRELLKKGFVPRQDVDSAQALADQAAAALDEAKQALALLQAGSRQEEIAAARAHVRQAEIAAKTAGSTADQNVVSARARSEAADSALRAAQADLDLARAGSRREEIDAARAQVREARAALAAARAGTSRDAAAEAQVSAARADLQRVSERLAAARVQLNDTRILAPISGTVTARQIRAGELVASAVTGLSAGISVLTIADLSSLLVRVRLNEVDVARVRVGQPAEIRVDAYPGVIFPGRVAKISPAAQENQNKAGQDTQIVRFDVEVALVRPDVRLRTGMTASVDIQLDRHDRALYTLREAALRENDRWYAWVVREPAKVRGLKWAQRKELREKDVPARKVPIRVGLRDDTRLEVLSGLRDNDLLLVKDAGRVQRRRFNVEHDF